MTERYKKPDSRSEPGEWHEITFKISIDAPVDWDNVDLRKWASAMTQYTAIKMAESDIDEYDKTSTLKAFLLDLSISRVSMLDEVELESFLEDTDDE